MAAAGFWKGNSVWVLKCSSKLNSVFHFQQPGSEYREVSFRLVAFRTKHIEPISFRQRCNLETSPSPVMAAGRAVMYEPDHLSPPRCEGAEQKRCWMWAQVKHANPVKLRYLVVPTALCLGPCWLTKIETTVSESVWWIRRIGPQRMSKFTVNIYFFHSVMSLRVGSVILR